MMTEQIEYGFERNGDIPRQRVIWWLKGEHGGCHIWAQFTVPNELNPDGFYGGIEVHHPTKVYEFLPDEAPIEECWLTGKPCWPDGSSLQFEERIKPMIRTALSDLRILDNFMNAEMLSFYRHNVVNELEPAD